MKDNILTIGSRGSKLALTQTNMMRDVLNKAYPNIEIVVKIIKTTGDKILDVPLSKIGDKGLFTKELEEALLREEIDLAVHSLKDLPTLVPKGIAISAITKRLNSCDILVSQEKFTIETLPSGARIGTSSLRRRAQILSIRKDLQILDLRGNLDTRIKKLEEGQFDAIILASAGVERLGLNLNASSIHIDDIIPQAGQGALGIETREDDAAVIKLVKSLEHEDSRLAVEGERSLLGRLEGGCQVPIGVSAEINANSITIRAGVFSLDGKRSVRNEIEGNKNSAVALGLALAENLLTNGAKEILDELTDYNKEHQSNEDMKSDV